MDRYAIKGHEVHEGATKPTGNGASVQVTKRWIGGDVTVVRVSEPDHDE